MRFQTSFTLVLHLTTLNYTFCLCYSTNALGSFIRESLTEEHSCILCREKSPTSGVVDKKEGERLYKLESREGDPCLRERDRFLPYPLSVAFSSSIHPKGGSLAILGTCPQGRYALSLPGTRSVENRSSLTDVLRSPPVVCLTPRSPSPAPPPDTHARPPPLNGPEKASHLRVATQGP